MLSSCEMRLRTGSGLLSTTTLGISAMPQPKQVWAVVSQGKVQGKAVGKTITLDAKALK